MGLVRKMWSVSTLGLIDFRSDKERMARYGKQSRNELRRQTRIMRNSSGGPVLVASPQDHQDVVVSHAPVAVKPKRQSMAKKLEQNPQMEVPMWIAFVAISLICVLASLNSLLFVIPVGLYLFYARQTAARNLKQRKHDSDAARFDAMDAPTQVIQAVKVPRQPRHAR